MQGQSSSYREVEVKPSLQLLVNIRTVSNPVISFQGAKGKREHELFTTFGAIWKNIISLKDAEHHHLLWVQCFQQETIFSKWYRLVCCFLELPHSIISMPKVLAKHRGNISQKFYFNLFIVWMVHCRFVQSTTQMKCIAYLWIGAISFTVFYSITLWNTIFVCI